MDQQRKTIVRDAFVFAIKLWVDSLKDVILAFAGLGAAALDVIRGKGEDGWLFYRVMKLGERADKALDLYGHNDPPDELGR